MPSWFIASIALGEQFKMLDGMCIGFYVKYSLRFSRKAFSVGCSEIRILDFYVRIFYGIS